MAKRKTHVGRAGKACELNQPEQDNILNYLIAGGFHSGQFVLFCSRPLNGKNTR